MVFRVHMKMQMLTSLVFQFYFFASTILRHARTDGVAEETLAYFNRLVVELTAILEQGRRKIRKPPISEDEARLAETEYEELLAEIDVLGRRLVDEVGVIECLPNLPHHVEIDDAGQRLKRLLPEFSTLPK